MNRRFFLAGAALPILHGCDVVGPSWTLRYRFTLRVRDRGREYSGSSVFRTQYRRSVPRQGGQGWKHSSSTWGEAIPVDLGERGLLVGVLGNAAHANPEVKIEPAGPRSIIGPLARSGLLPNAIADDEQAYERASQLHGEHLWHSLPGLLHFDQSRNLKDVRVLRECTKGTARSDLPLTSLAEVLGHNASIEMPTIEFVSAEPTAAIDDVLPWVATMNGTAGGIVPSLRRPFSEGLSYWNFKRRGLEG